MIMDKDGKFVPSTYCHPHQRPKYESEQDALDEVFIEEIDMLEDEQKEETQFKMKDLVKLKFGMEESTLSMVISMPLDEEKWRAIQRERGSSDVFSLEIPFGGNTINFFLKGDEDSPILAGK